jgi:hypothetical protein
MKELAAKERVEITKKTRRMIRPAAYLSKG